MGRSSREVAERNRERVVETACRLFREHGVEAVSIADIMGAAGLTPGGFYKHFESKEALINEAFSLAFTQSADSWTQVRTSQQLDDADDGLAKLVKHYFKRRPPERNCPMLSLASEASRQTPDSVAAGVYGEGAEALFSQFREAAIKASHAKRSGLHSEDEILVLFAAMVGAGLLNRAVGDTSWIDEMKSAILAALPK